MEHKKQCLKPPRLNFDLLVVTSVDAAAAVPVGVQQPVQSAAAITRQIQVKRTQNQSRTI